MLLDNDEFLYVQRATQTNIVALVGPDAFAVALRDCAITSSSLHASYISSLIIAMGYVIRVMRVRYDVLTSLSYTRTTQIHHRLTPWGRV